MLALSFPPCVFKQFVAVPFIESGTHTDNQVLNNQSVLAARAALWFTGWRFSQSAKASVRTGLCSCVHSTIDETSRASCPLADGCPNLCNGNGQCTMGQQSWHCECQTGWRGPGCSVAMETSCADNKDNEGGELGRVEHWDREGGIESRTALLSIILLHLVFAKEYRIMAKVKLVALRTGRNRRRRRRNYWSFYYYIITISQVAIIQT